MSPKIIYSRFLSTKFAKVLCRVWLELAFFIANGILLFYFKDRVSNPALQLLMFKSLLINAGLIHATVTRHILFPYISFETERRLPLQLIIVALYIVLPYCYCLGG